VERRRLGVQHVHQLRRLTFINFDGWNYLSVELPFRYASGFYGPPRRNWLCTGGDGVVDYPIRFTRLVVEMRDRVLHLIEPIPVPDPTIRLRAGTWVVFKKECSSTITRLHGPLCAISRLNAAMSALSEHNAGPRPTVQQPLPFACSLQLVAADRREAP